MRVLYMNVPQMLGDSLLLLTVSARARGAHAARHEGALELSRPSIARSRPTRGSRAASLRWFPATPTARSASSPRRRAGRGAGKTPRGFEILPFFCKKVSEDPEATARRMRVFDLQLPRLPRAVQSAPTCATPAGGGVPRVFVRAGARDLMAISLRLTGSYAERVRLESTRRCMAEGPRAPPPSGRCSAPATIPRSPTSAAPEGNSGSTKSRSHLSGTEASCRRRLARYHTAARTSGASAARTTAGGGRAAGLATRCRTGTYTLKDLHEDSMPRLRARLAAALLPPLRTYGRRLVRQRAPAACEPRRRDVGCGCRR